MYNPPHRKAQVPAQVQVHHDFHFPTALPAGVLLDWWIVVCMCICMCLVITSFPSSFLARPLSKSSCNIHALFSTLKIFIRFLARSTRYFPTEIGPSPTRLQHTRYLFPVTKNIRFTFGFLPSQFTRYFRTKPTRPQHAPYFCPKKKVQNKTLFCTVCSLA